MARTPAPPERLPDALLDRPARGRNLGAGSADAPPTWRAVLGEEPVLLWFLRPVT